MAPDVPDVAGAVREVHNARDRLNRLPANPTSQQINVALEQLRNKTSRFERSEHITPVVLAIDQHLTALRGNTTVAANVHRTALEGVRQELSDRMDTTTPRTIIRNSIGGLSQVPQDIVTTVQDASQGRANWGKIGAYAAGITGVAYLGYKALFGTKDPPKPGEEPQGAFGSALTRVGRFGVVALTALGLGFLVQNRAEAARISSTDVGRNDLLPANTNTPVEVPGVPGMRIVRANLDGQTSEVLLIGNGTRYRLGFAPAAAGSAPRNMSGAIRTISTRPGQSGATLEYHDAGLSTVFNNRGLRLSLDSAALTQVQMALTSAGTADTITVPNVAVTVDITAFSPQQLTYVQQMSAMPPVAVGNTLRLTTNLVLRAGEPVPQLPNTLTATPPTPATPVLIAVPATQPVELPGGPALAATEGATAEHNNVRLTRLAGRNAVRVDIVPPVTVAGNRTVKINGTDYSFNVVATGPAVGAAERPEAIRGQTLERGRTRLLAAPRDQAVEIASTHLLILGRETIAANADDSKTFRGITIARTAAGLSITPTATADAGTYKLKIGASEYTFTVAPLGPPVGAPENISDVNKRRMDAGTTRVFAVPANQEVKLGTVTLEANSPFNTALRDPASKITLERLPGGQLRVTLDATTPAGSHALKVNNVDTPIVVPALSDRIPGTVNHGNDITSVGTADLELVVGADTKSLSAASATADFGRGLVFSRKANGDITVALPHTHPDATATVQLKRGTETKNVTVNREADPAVTTLTAAETLNRNTHYRRALPAAGDVSLVLTNATGTENVTVPVNNTKVEAALINTGTRYVTFTVKSADITKIAVKCPPAAVAIAEHTLN